MNVELRAITDADLPLILAWRNISEVQKGIYTQKGLLSWEEHLAWHKNRCHHWKRFIIELNDGETTRPVGYVYISNLEGWSPEIGYAVGEPLLWGKGIGKQAISLALEWLRDKGYNYVHTTVLKNNERSLRLLQSLGFKVVGDAREGEVYMSRHRGE